MHGSNEKCAQTFSWKPKGKDISWETTHVWKYTVEMELKM